MSKQATRGVIILGLAGVALWAMQRRASAAGPLPQSPDLPPPSPPQGGPGGFAPPDVTDDPEGGAFTSVVPSTPPTDAIEPWEVLDELESETPIAGHFYQVRRGDTFLGQNRQSIAYQALLAFARDVAAENGLPDSWAKDFAASHRVGYLDLILCSGWNDLLYGTFGYGAQAHVGPHGRSIRLLRDHAFNRDRIARGLAPIRNIAMGRPGDGGTGTGTAVDPVLRDSFEFLWLPGLDRRAALLEGKATTLGSSWPDGSTTINPPPEIMDLGVETVRDPGLRSYGCATPAGDGVIA